MKKTVLVVALAFGVSGAFAQGLTSKKGEPFMPETGDWAISMDVNPIFNWVGNFFSQNGNNNAPGVGFLNGNQTIIGKKYTSPTDAMRVLVRIGLTSQKDKQMVNEDLTTPVVFPNFNPQVEDSRKISNTTVGIGVGKEMRRGKTRLQGFYGADAMLWFSGSKTTYAYGNAITATNQDPTTYNFGNNVSFDPSGAVITRVLESKQGTTIGIGVRGFIGVDYFIFPKIAIGAEFGWGIGFQTTGKGKLTTETSGANAANPPVIVVAEQQTDIAGASKFGIDTDLNQSTIFGFHGSNTGSASLRATFHF